MARHKIDPTKPYRVKPLKWERLAWGANVQSLAAEALIGYYHLRRVKVGDPPKWVPWELSWCFVEYYDEGRQEVASLEEGKREAWEDWLKRIRPALTEL